VIVSSSSTAAHVRPRRGTDWCGVRCGVILLVLLSGVGACGPASDSAPAPLDGEARFGVRTNADATPPAVPFDAATPRVQARALASWPHDSTAYTQGLLLTEDRLIESTGIAGESDVREVDLPSGRILRRSAVLPSAFGEGAAVLAGRLYQLTWRGERGYVYDAATLTVIDSMTYTGEGWGLTTDGIRLFLSDGTDQIRVINPKSFAVERVFKVAEAGRPVWMLNELEWADGELLANVYQTDLIARIEPGSGRVIGWIDVGGLLTPEERASVVQRGGVANGVAFDSRRRRLLITGKRWPRIFEIAIPPSPTPAGG
jgi:glutaminyl-peptide cyclotransferase